MHVFAHTLSVNRIIYVQNDTFIVFFQKSGEILEYFKESTMLWKHSFRYILKISFLRKIGTHF